MQVRDAPLFLLAAAVFPDIMAGGGPGNEAQVHRDIALAQLAGHVHGHIMDAADMPQCIKGRNVDADAHEFIDVIIPYEFLHVEIFRNEAVGPDFIAGQELHILRRVKGQGIPFIQIEAAQDLQQQDPADAVRRCIVQYNRHGRFVPGRCIFREQPGQDGIIAVRQPAAFGHGSKDVQILCQAVSDSGRIKPAVFIR